MGEEEKVIRIWESSSFCPHGTHIWELASAMTSTLTVMTRSIWVQDAHTILTEIAFDLEKSQRVLRGIRTKPDSLTWHPFPSAEDPLPNAFVNYKNIFSPTTLMSAQYLFCKIKSQITVEWSCPRRRHRLTSSNQLWVQTSFQKPNSIDHQSLIH